MRKIVPILALAVLGFVCASCGNESGAPDPQKQTQLKPTGDQPEGAKPGGGGASSLTPPPPVAPGTPSGPPKVGTKTGG
jgi:hypothetical protein